MRLVLGLALAVVGCGASSPSSPPPPPCAPFNIDVFVGSWNVDVLWTGAEYLLVSRTPPGYSPPVYVQAIAADGTAGARFPLGIDLGPWASIVWTGSEVGALSVNAGTTGNDLMLSRFAADGTALGPATVVGELPRADNQRVLAWAGDRYLVGWPTVTTDTETATIEEVSADGVPGASHVLDAATVGASFDTITSLAATSKAFLVEVGRPNETATYVTIDRATGATAFYRSSSNVVPTQVVARATDFAFYTTSPDRTDGTQGPGLVMLDAHATPTYGPVLPAVAGTYLTATPSGYRMTGTTADGNTMYVAVWDLDLGPDGSALGSPTEIASSLGPTYTSHPSLTFRGNGSLTWFTYAPGDSVTERLIQECSP